MKNDIHDFGPYLPGVKRKTLRGKLCKSVTAMMVALYRYRLAAAAGDHGSAMVYRDDAGDFRCMYQVRHQTVDAQTVKTRAAATRWLKVWFPKMRGY